jgi:hypothetical protein
MERGMSIEALATPSIVGVKQPVDNVGASVVVVVGAAAGIDIKILAVRTVVPSLAVTMCVLSAVVAGVPEITPVAALIVSPAGNTGEMVKLVDALIPEVVNAIVEVIAVPARALIV